MKHILTLAIVLFSSFGFSAETSTFINEIKNRECGVLLDIVLERTVEAHRLGLAAFNRLQKDENDKSGKELLSLSNKERVISIAVKELLIDKCFNQK